MKKPTTTETITELNKAIRILEQTRDSLLPPPVAKPKNLEGRRVAICVGHSRANDTGATAPGGVTEYAWNKPIAHTMKANLTALGAEALVLDKYGYLTDLSYSQAMDFVATQVKDFEAELVVELHFNSSSDRSVRGFETLITGSQRGTILGNCLQDAMAELFPGEPNRGVKVRTRNQRGSAFLFKCAPPAAILEPLFASNVGAWDTYKDRRDDVSHCYTMGIVSYLQQVS
tara:strand:+ start:456 stop:1145 length:690 start_codon:yes stop_codon:yes gene_type:complete